MITLYYLKMSVRFLTRARSYTIINLLGLAFSLACSIILLRYIHRELTVDANCIHPETVVLPLADVYSNWCPSTRMYMDSVYLADEQVIERCLVVPNERTNILYENRTYNADILAVDSTFFRFFAYPVATMQGDHVAILTRKFAEQLFGRENPLGKVLVYDGISVVVQGVVDSPSNKTVWRFDVLVSRGLQDWNRMNIEMVRVLPGIDLDAINKVSGVYRDTKYSGPMRYRFIPWKQFYFDPSIIAEKSLMNHGDRSYLLILSGVIVLLLAVGILNFINLYMVMLMKRSREYGIKKVLGLGRSSLFVEIWLENFVLVFASLFVAWVLIEVTAVPVERLLGEQIGYTPFDGWLSLGILIVLPLLTSVYPYIKYGYRSPVISMRNVSVRYSVASRAVLLGVQYVFTVVLVVLSVYFSRHFDFLINTPPGFRTERILEADLQKENWNNRYTDEQRKTRNERIERIRKALDECPYIDSWICSSFDEITSEIQVNFFNEKDKKVSVKALFVPVAFFEFYGLKVLDGTLPDEIHDVTHSEIALNEEAMKLFGYADREEAFIRAEAPIWVFFGADGSVKKGGLELMPVVAVIADCYFGKLTGGVQPIVYVISGGYERGKISIAVQPGKEKELLAYLRRTVKEIYGTEEFDHAWLADVVEEQYAHDRKIATVYSVFAFIAIVVSCMGLFGISLFDIRRRYREIAIRKVNGATLRDLYWLLGGRYLKVLLVSFAHRQVRSATPPPPSSVLGA
ncbi:ABC transporter permease [Bacteroides sp. An19]|uniref:ABC transporter permease n=1 Tax=Bacteroides sp. An19 TaxID=1965580 RepID=UPI000B373A0F|nr:ABC transporter permease [Bacteroides sp. An19]OUP26820.1 hypothetical protein B5F25_19885 [Bacteroides sp. An19]